MQGFVDSQSDEQSQKDFPGSLHDLSGESLTLFIARLRACWRISVAEQHLLVALVHEISNSAERNGMPFRKRSVAKIPHIKCVDAL